MKKLAFPILLLLLLCTPNLLMAQNGGPDGSSPQGENLQVPEGWEWRFDRSNDVTVGADAEKSDIYFVNMTPGWHITTGPGGIYYHLENNALGAYELTASIYLFDTMGRNREAFGLFFGGKDLKNEEQSYVYFLIRNTGEYLIKRRVGTETENIQGWTDTDAMNLFTEETESSVKNDFKVKVSNENMTFYLNEAELVTLPKNNLNTDGKYGLRVNHSINLHVSSLKVK